MSMNQAANINELKELSGARDTRELCDFYGYENASELWKPVKELKAAELLGLSIFTLRNYRHLSKGPDFIKHGTAVTYLPLELHLYNLRNQVHLEVA